MQRFVLFVVLSVLLFVSSLNASHQHLKHHGHNHQTVYQHKEHIAPSVCKFTATDGSNFDITPLGSATDLQFVDELNSNTYYFHACGNVVTEGCAADASVCMIDATGVAVSFGASASAQFSDGVEGESTFEAMYGNGDACADPSVNRKTLVEFVCSLNSNTTSIASAESDGCFLTLVVESPNACDVPTYCKSLESEEECRDTSDVCVWKKLHLMSQHGGDQQKGVCQPKHQMRHVESYVYGIVAILFAVTGLVVFLFVGMMCVNRRLAKRARKARRAQENAESGMKMKNIDNTHYEEQSMVEELAPSSDASAPVQIAVFYPQQGPTTPYTGYGYQPLSLHWAAPQTASK